MKQWLFSVGKQNYKIEQQSQNMNIFSFTVYFHIFIATTNHGFRVDTLRAEIFLILIYIILKGAIMEYVSQKPFVLCITLHCHYTN